ncbi:hypothetical protein NPA08_02755 [Mycoplasmopsis citelli]|uniref:hypothetical protein n=1 Tax=Mycoplasmopsis citelli TaxID=171281 RepID=UPI00211520B8|nr:hypothetical protein [Mycoplasmopsis citelli]UUD35866.1 hypothetical protein NPA08_02755 [Mycoplasmopsis citelli]
MKRNRVLKHLFLLVTPAIISIASVSCSSPKTPPQKGGGSQETPGSEKTPPNNNGEDKPHQEPGTDPQPEVQNPSNPDPDPDDQKGKEMPTPNPSTGTTPSLSASFQELKAQIEKLSLYKDNFTKENYEEYFKNLKEQKASFINSEYTDNQFDHDIALLKKYYSQVLKLSEILKTKGDAEVKEYIDSLKSESNSIFKVENGVTTVNVLEINSLFNKLNSQNGKNVKEKSTPEDKPKGNSNSPKEESEPQPEVDAQKNLKDEYVKKLKGQLKELLFYEPGYTKEKYDDVIDKYTKYEEKFVNKSYTTTQFKLDVWNLKYLYRQVAELEEQFKDSVSYEQLTKHIKEVESKDNNIFTKSSDGNLPSIDFEKLNKIIIKLNNQATVKINQDNQAQAKK